MARRNKGILFLIVALFIFIQIILLLKHKEIWWDSAVYIGMGKYIFSFGGSGLWEASRPLVWPLLIGFLWKINLGILLMKLLNIGFGIGCVYMTYLIGRECFNEKTGIISSLLLAISPTFILFSTLMLTEVPSAFFSLAGIYFLIKKRYFLVGLLCGIAFMTKFLQLMVFATLLVFILINYQKEKKTLSKMASAVNGFLVIVLPYLIFNYYMYGKIAYPFFLQFFLTANTGWPWHMPWWFYFNGVIRESFISIFCIFGLVFIFRKIDLKKSMILALLIIFFSFFSLIKQKEMRFAVIFLPYLYLVSSYGLIEILGRFKRGYLKKAALTLILAGVIIYSGFQIFPLFNKQRQPDERSIFNKYLEDNNVSYGIWISSPVFAVYSDKKIDELVYYPFFDHNTRLRLEGSMQNANHILIDTCDLACSPKLEYCIAERQEFIEKIKNGFNSVYYNKNGECEQYIFRR